MIEARIILDSTHPQGDDYRLTTFLCRYPKFIHAEHCRHRAMSLCVSSSRAVPVSKNLEEVRSDELRAGPVYWASEQKGMSGGEEVEEVKDRAKQIWNWAALNAARTAERMVEIGVHKSIVNRLLEPFLHVNVLCTVVAMPGLMNFFGLRLDKAAQPEIRVLAEQMWKAWNESRPQKLEPGQWHLPFIPHWEREEICLAANVSLGDYMYSKENWALFRKVDAARCARLSYTSFETGKRSTIEEDLALYDRLIGSKPIHASPAEHQATPDTKVEWKRIEQLGGPVIGTVWGTWVHPEQWGNLPGWIQHRKLLPNEACAALPEGYEVK